MTLLYIIAATTLISAIALVGALVLYRQKNKTDIVRSIVSLAAGSMLAVAFLDLLPEAIEDSAFEPHFILGTVLVGILVFFIFERVLHWHHCHDERHEESPHKHNLLYLNLMGDALHNLIDGFLVASAFMLDVSAGIFVSIAVILHEIPQEISDFGVLLYSGLSKMKAILYNVLIGIIAILGGVIFYFFGSTFEQFIPLIVALAAANFIYLSTADLIPELYHEKDRKKVIIHTFWLLAGVVIVYGIIQVVPHAH